MVEVVEVVVDVVDDDDDNDDDIVVKNSFLNWLLPKILLMMQCGNLRIILPLTIYVKLILKILEAQNLQF